MCQSHAMTPPPSNGVRLSPLRRRKPVPSSLSHKHHLHIRWCCTDWLRPPRISATSHPDPVPKSGHGNDRVWKAIKPAFGLSTLPTLFGNPFRIPTLPRPRRRVRFRSKGKASHTLNSSPHLRKGLVTDVPDPMCKGCSGTLTCGRLASKSSRQPSAFSFGVSVFSFCAKAKSEARNTLRGKGATHFFMQAA
jgi:hypothetical protein